MDTRAKKAAGVGTAGLVMWLLMRVYALNAEVARLEERIQAQKERISFFHGLATIDEIKEKAEKAP